jgi:hypothetical protein
MDIPTPKLPLSRRKKYLTGEEASETKRFANGVMPRLAGTKGHNVIMISAFHAGAILPHMWTVTHLREGLLLKDNTHCDSNIRVMIAFLLLQGLY